MHQSTPPRRTGAAPCLSHYLWSVAMLASSLACSGESPRSVASAERDTSLPAVTIDTGAPPTGDRVDRGVPAAGEDDIDPEMGMPGELAVLKRYFSAINERRFHDAYVMWEDRGAASGISFEEFAHGYDGTRSTSVIIGRPGSIEGAVGSRYIDVPVTINAVTVDGKRQHYHGSIVLRRVVVPGADTADRRWHLYSAAIDESP
jgi:hypothetical protein